MIFGFVIPLSPGQQPPAVLWALSGVVWFFAALFFYLGLRPVVLPLTKLFLDTTGLRLQFGGGGARTLAWDDPTFGLGLARGTKDGFTTAGERRYVSLSTHDGWKGFVGPDVAEAVVAAASLHGLSILTRIELGRGQRFEVTRIGRAENTPGWKRAIALKQ